MVVILLLKAFKSKLTPPKTSADVVPNYDDVSGQRALKILIQPNSKF